MWLGRSGEPAHRGSADHDVHIAGRRRMDAADRGHQCGGSNYQGHQFMPHLVYAQGKLILVWYDQRYDEYGSQGVGTWISDNMADPPYDRCAVRQAEPGLAPAFQPSVQVSKYLWPSCREAIARSSRSSTVPPTLKCSKAGQRPFTAIISKWRRRPNLCPGRTAGNSIPSRRARRSFTPFGRTTAMSGRPRTEIGELHPSGVEPGSVRVQRLRFGQPQCDGHAEPEYLYGYTGPGIAAAAPSNTKTLETWNIL